MELTWTIYNPRLCWEWSRDLHCSLAVSLRLKYLGNHDLAIKIKEAGYWGRSHKAHYNQSMKQTQRWLGDYRGNKAKSISSLCFRVEAMICWDTAERSSKITREREKLSGEINKGQLQGQIERQKDGRKLRSKGRWRNGGREYIHLFWKDRVIEA